MNVKVVFVIVCLCAFAIFSTEGGIPKCCVTTKTNIPIHLLRKVQRWEFQDNTGACDIIALKLYVKSFVKPICADSKYMKILQRKMKLRSRF